MLLLGVCTLALDTTAFAQDTNNIEAVTVTGSRVARKGFETPTPTTAISAAELESKASLTVTDIIAEIPSLAPNQNPNNSSNVGLVTFNLRNIGPSRTLVLLDGLRVADTSPTGGFSVNVIPAPLITKIDVVTGGASAAYGSDGITGVVNIQLTPQMTGGKLQLQADASNYGDDHGLSAALTYGHDFFSNRAHFVFAGSYYNQPKIIYEKARPWGRQGYTEFTNTKAAVAAGGPQFVIAPGGTLTQITYGGVIDSGPAGFINQQFLAGGVLAPFNRGGICGGTSYCQNGDGVQTYNTPAGVLLPSSERYSLYGRFGYDLSPTTQIYASILYSNDNEVQTNVPNYNNGDLTIKNDNAYLPMAVKTQMATLGLSSFLLGRENLEDGSTINDARSIYSRYLVGANGQLPFGSTWTWDGHAMLTQNNYTNSAQNNRIQANFFNAVDSVANPALGGVAGVPVGTAVCRSTLTAPTNGCVPVNLFGPNTISSSALAYYRGTSVVDAATMQWNAGFNVRGDLFDTWAGPVSFAGGGEYRRDSINQASDAISHTLGWRQASAAPFYGANQVREGYVETVVPLTPPNIPLIQKLEVDVAARVADYDSSGAAFVWKGGANWVLNDRIRFRTSYSRDFRAPSVNDLYSAAGVSNGATVVDRVTTLPNGSPNPNLGNSFTVQTLTGGNPNLKPETANTFTVGTVVSPIEGLQLSVDYYSIKMGNALSTFAIQDVVNNCNLGSATFCAAITRSTDPVTGFAITKVLSSAFNAASLQVSGVDFEGSYNQPLQDWFDDWDATVGISNLTSYAEHIKTIVNGIAQENAGFLTGGNSLPHWRSATNFTYSEGPVSARVTMYWIGPGLYGPTTYRPTDINIYHYSGRTYFDLGLEYDLTDRVELYGKINNALNQDPPLLAENATLKALADTSNIYDRLGRVFGIGVRYRW
ncbi:MAG: TonB-dependent receptor-like protein [Candidatus Kaiserbacteria bacterium]|nr:TonB-dependent receptor-like protein [Candidatus Kaiserbacteria bacterium]